MTFIPARGGRWTQAAFLAAALAAALAAPAGRAAAANDELDLSANPAGIIQYPTALDQLTPNSVRGTLEIYDLAAPDLRPANLEYGRQWNNVQLLADMDWQPRARAFDHAEAKAKVRAINFDTQRTYIALGAIARWTDQTSKWKPVFDNRPYSLLGILTTELYPFDAWGAFLFNFYVDNRFADLGLKVPLYESIKFVAETDYHHGDVNNAPRKWRNKAGLEFDGDKDFYMQLFFDDAGNHTRVQMGWGF
jgi:hypothetical protein